MLSDERIRQIADDIYCSEGTRAEIEHSIRAALAEAAQVPVMPRLVSVDVSTGYSDAGHRIFATPLGMQGDVLLCEEESRNFLAQVPVMGEAVAWTSPEWLKEKGRLHGMTRPHPSFKLPLYRAPATCITQAELERLRKDAGRYRWQPIETAPKDGSAILLGLPAIGALRHEGRRVYEGRWNGEQFAFTSINGFILLDGAITWMPLPPPPISEEAAMQERQS